MFRKVGPKILGMKNVVRYLTTFHNNWTSTIQEYGSIGIYLGNMISFTTSEYRRQSDERRADEFYYHGGMTVWHS